MLKTTLAWSALLLCLAFANGAQADKSAAIASLMKQSGLTAQLAEIPAQFQQGVEQGISQSGGPAEMAEQLMAGIGDRLNAEVFVADIGAAIDQGMSLQEVQTINEWYTTDLAKKVTALEVASGTLEHSTYVMENLDSLLSNHERIAKARQVEDVLGGSDMAINMMTSMQTAMINTMMANAPDAQRQMVLEQVQQQIEMAMPQITEMTLATYVATYSELSDSEFNGYLAFLGTPEATKFYQVVITTMGTTMGNAFGGLVPTLTQ